MSFILLQILVCLLIAALIGGVIGWFLRGSCSKEIKRFNERCEEKMRAVEREWNTKLNYTNEDEIDINADLVDVDDIAHADLKNKKDTNPMHSTSLFGAVASALGVSGYENKPLNSKELLSKKNISLSDEKIKLYEEYDIDFENSDNLQDNYDIEEIVGISSRDAKIFKELGINTTKDLVEKLDKNYKDIDLVAEKLKIQPEDITSWISMADFLTLPGLDAKEAQLLEYSGISSVRELSVVNIYSLYKKLMELNEESSIVKDVPAIKSIELWSNLAKKFGGA